LAADPTGGTLGTVGEEATHTDFSLNLLWIVLGATHLVALNIVAIVAALGGVLGTLPTHAVTLDVLFALRLVGLLDLFRVLVSHCEPPSVWTVISPSYGFSRTTSILHRGHRALSPSRHVGCPLSDTYGGISMTG
jgi:hypothetical protein